MSPVTHALVGWLAGEAVPESRRLSAWALVAGIAPDLDGLGIVVEVATSRWDEALTWYTDYHRVLCHNLPFTALVAAAAAAHCRSWKAGGVALVAGHLHLLGDLVGSKGPDGFVWSVPYLPGVELAWAGQWELNAWPNVVLTLAALVVTFELARRRGHSPVGLLSRRADAAFVEALRQRFGRI